MIVVGHQGISVNLQAMFFAGIVQQFQKGKRIVIIANDKLAISSTVHHVVPGTGIIYSEWSSHKQNTDIRRDFCQLSVSDTSLNYSEWFVNCQCLTLVSTVSV